MKKILLLTQSAGPQSGGMALRDLLRTALPPDTTVEMTSYSRLIFTIDGASATIRDLRQGFDVAEFDLVVFRLIGRHLEEAIAVAAYCRRHSIPYIDRFVPAIGNDKLSCLFVRREHGLAVPDTAYGPLDGILQAAQQFGLPAVLKANAGKKGRDNYLVRTAEEIRMHVTAPGAPAFVLQKFIANDGDYRILVFNGAPVMVIKRTAAPESHLNNTSQGGTAEQVAPATLPKAVLDLAVSAARLDRVAIAGVDIIIDKETGKPYVLEVNRAPQITTGAFAGGKLQHYAAALTELLQEGKTV